MNQNAIWLIMQTMAEFEKLGTDACHHKLYIVILIYLSIDYTYTEPFNKTSILHLGFREQKYNFFFSGFLSYVHNCDDQS